MKRRSVVAAVAAMVALLAPRSARAAEPTPKPPEVFQPGLLLQVWGRVQHDYGEEVPLAGSFRIRRVEVKAKGEIIEGWLKYEVMFDLAKLLKFGSEPGEVTSETGDEIGTVEVPIPPADTSVLQDATMTLTTDYVDVSFGQMKNLMSLEGMTSSSKLTFPERSLVSRAYGDRRDIGFRLEKKFDIVSYGLGLWNGQGTNQVDLDGNKDVTARLEVTPFPGLMLGGAGQVTLGDRDSPGTKDRAEIDARFDLAGVWAQTEYIVGWDVQKDATRRMGHGAYVGFGYTFDFVQPTARVGFFDPDFDADEDATIQTEIGVNWLIQKHNAKVTATWAAFRREVEGGHRDALEGTLAGQVAF